MREWTISSEEQEFKMKRLHLVTVIFIGLALSVSGCAPKTNKVKTSNNNNTTSTFNNNPIPGYTPPPGYPNPPSATPVDPHPDPYSSNNCGANSGLKGGGIGYGSGNEAGHADAGQTINYYKVNDPPVTAHGNGTGVTVWSSQTDLSPSISQSVFFTNSRFNLRVIPRVVTQGATDTRTGANCQYVPRPYQKLKVGVRLRRADLSTGDYYQFGVGDFNGDGESDGIPLNQASRVHEFQVPQGSSQPLVVEVLNIEWDWSCYEYETQNYCNVPGFCPWDKVWMSECVSVELQFSTDDTKDIVGIRTSDP